MENLIIIKTAYELNKLRSYLVDKDFIAYDVETTGVEEESSIIGLSVCSDIEVGYYVVLSYWDVEAQKLVDLETKSRVHRLIQDLTTKQLIMHNSPFDCRMTYNNFKIELMPSVHTDTMILGHNLDENRSNGLKELGTTLFGEDTRTEQTLMKESVHKNGGVLTKDKYELYKADADLIAQYGAKDAILTLKLFYALGENLLEQKLDKFFYEDESMPLLKGPTYDLNTVGLRVDPDKLQNLKNTLEAECLEAKAFIHKEIAEHVKVKYKGDKPSNTFNIGSSKQLAWLLFFELKNEFYTLTKGGKELCKAMNIKPPYNRGAKREFIELIASSKDQVYEQPKWNWKTKKMSRPKKIGDPWNYIACGKDSLQRLAPKYKWVEKFLEYAKNLKLLNTYVEGIQSKMRYNIIRPSFLQHGTTSGRYSSRRPNFQNLPRDDKRVKACIVARPGNVFVGADYAQLEPRVFASVSQDETLMKCFSEGKDFYSVVGAPIFGKEDCTMYKDDKDSFAKKYPTLRDKSKIIALATPYGRTAFQQASTMGITTEEGQALIDKYFELYPKVELMMLESHEQAKSIGVVHNLYGRPRRIPEAMKIKEIYGNSSHAELPYQARTLLNLAMNHRVQSTGASIMNRAAIACYAACRMLEEQDPEWANVRIVLQVHDELVLEGPEHLAHSMSLILKECMEHTTILPGVELVADPKIGHSLAELK